MYALATAVHLDNQATGRRQTIIVPRPSAALIPELLAVFAEYERSDDFKPVGLCLRIYPDRTIRIVMFPADATAAAEKLIAAIDQLSDEERDEVREHLDAQLGDEDEGSQQWN